MPIQTQRAYEQQLIDLHNVESMLRDGDYLVYNEPVDLSELRDRSDGFTVNIQQGPLKYKVTLEISNR